MPYIPNWRRTEMQNEGLPRPQNPGELNYTITEMLNEYLETKGLSYQSINDILGALEGTKLEFYSRIAVPYEKGKCEINGDVYSPKFILK